MRFRVKNKHLPAHNDERGDRGRFEIRFAILPRKVVNGVRGVDPNVRVLWEHYLVYQTLSRCYFPVWNQYGKGWVDRYEVTTDESDDYADLFTIKP